ncbi:MAG: hypothetical protein V6Z82_04340 [Flavobacteriales bacterium]
MKTWFLILISFLIFKTAPPCIAADADNERGVIHGRVLLEGDVPDLPQIVVDKSVDFCGKKVTDPVLMVQDQGIQGAVVSIEWEGDILINSPPKPVSLQSRQCLFHPRIQATHVDAFLTLNSGDEIAHNPHGWWNDKKTVFNITLLDRNVKFKRKLKWDGTYRVECDTHTWMKAYILVFKHPFYTVTDAKGIFVLKNIPVGAHTLRAWHEVLGEQTTTVIVEPSKETTAEFSFPLVDHRREELKPQTVSPWVPTRKKSEL